MGISPPPGPGCSIVGYQESTVHGLFHGASGTIIGDVHGAPIKTPAYVEPRIGSDVQGSIGLLLQLRRPCQEVGLHEALGG